MTNYRQVIKARVQYIEESQWWRENKWCKIGKSLEDFERANIIEAAKEYRVQFGKLEKELQHRGIMLCKKSTLRIKRI